MWRGQRQVCSYRQVRNPALPPNWNAQADGHIPAASPASAIAVKGKKTIFNLDVWSLFWDNSPCLSSPDPGLQQPVDISPPFEVSLRALVARLILPRGSGNGTRVRAAGAEIPYPRAGIQLGTPPNRARLTHPVANPHLSKVGAAPGASLQIQALKGCSARLGPPRAPLKAALVIKANPLPFPLCLLFDLGRGV